MKSIMLAIKHTIEGSSLEIGILSVSAFLSFIASYFLNLAIAHSELYISLMLVTFLDGFFGIIYGTKKEGFKTYKAIKVLRTTVIWIIIATVLLSIEIAIPAASWLSETILLPYMILQVISALKNASLSGYIKSDVLNNILKKIDRHKDNT